MTQWQANIMIGLLFGLQTDSMKMRYSFEGGTPFDEMVQTTLVLITALFATWFLAKGLLAYINPPKDKKDDNPSS